MTGASIDAILDEMEYVKDQPCDIIEWRVDFYEDAHDEEAVFALLPKIREIIGEDKVLMFVVRNRQMREVISLLTENIISRL